MQLSGSSLNDAPMLAFFLGILLVCHKTIPSVPSCWISPLPLSSFVVEALSSALLFQMLPALISSCLVEGVYAGSAALSPRQSICLRCK